MSRRDSQEEETLRRQASLPPGRQCHSYYPRMNGKSKYLEADIESCDSTSTSSDSVSSESFNVPREVKLEGECTPMVPNHYEQPGMMLTMPLEKKECEVWENDREFEMESSWTSNERSENHIREDTCSVISVGSTMFGCFEKESKTLINSDGNGSPTADDIATFQERCLECSMRMEELRESEEPKSERASDRPTLPGPVDPLGKHLNGDDHTQSRDAQNDRSEQATHYLQLCFVEVATWADSFFWARDFGQLVLKHASESLMVLNAVFACATVTSGEIEKSFSYVYASERLSEASRETIQDSAKYAVASIVLSIYETKLGEYEQSLRRIDTSRAFMQECQWNAESTGFGLACFWLNIEIEVNNCLATNRQTAWSPNELGMVSLSVDKNEHAEQIWAQSTLCVLAEVVNFRAQATRSKHAGPQHQQTWRKFVTLYNSWLTARTIFGCVETTPTTILSTWKLQQTISIVDFRFFIYFNVLSQTALECPIGDEAARNDRGM